MPLRKLDFKPTHYCTITVFSTLRVQHIKENCEDYFLTAFFNGEEISLPVTRCLVQSTRGGLPYIVKNKRRYYLDEFIKLEH